MVQKLFHIRINSTEANMDSGFYTLITSGSAIQCLNNEEYIIPEKLISKLNQRNIAYEIVPQKFSEINWV